MLGGMLAGHEESEAKLVDGKRVFYGMSSQTALDTHGARKMDIEVLRVKLLLCRQRSQRIQ